MKTIIASSNINGSYACQPVLSFTQTCFSQDFFRRKTMEIIISPENVNGDNGDGCKNENDCGDQCFHAHCDFCLKV